MSVFMVTSALRPDFGGATSVPNSFDLDTRLTPSISFYSKCHLSKVFSFFLSEKNFFLMVQLLFIFLQVFFFFLFFLLLFKYSCLHFPTITFPCPTRPYHPPSIHPPIGFVHGSFIHVPGWPFPIFPSYPPPSTLVAVNLLFISISLVIFCLIVCFVD